MPADPTTAVRLAQRYTLRERIAVGGMGEVHRATDDRLRREVAVKVLGPGLADAPEFVERFRREALTAAGLVHPNIAQVYDYGVDAGSHFIVMEYVPGSDLATLLREHGRVTPADAVHIAEQVCAALSAAHRAGVVHRDIKPGNVIVRPDGTVKVTDFGIAQALGQASLTDTGTVMGTAAYVSPEQARGQSSSPASDLYSLGILLFQMLTGAVPFKGETPVAVAMRHLDEPVPLPSSRVADLPANLDEVVTRATAKAPADRYPDADAMAAALHRREPEAESATRAMPYGAATSVFDAVSHTAAMPALDDDRDLSRPLPGTRPVAAGPATRTMAAPPVPVGPAAPAMASGAPTQPRPSRHDSRSDRPAAAQNLLVWALGAVVVALVATLAFVLLGDDGGTGGAQTPGTRPSATAPVPSTTQEQTPTEKPDGKTVPAGVVGQPREAAVEQLIDLGVDVRWVLVRSTSAEGTVLGTFPAEGQPMEQGQTVALVVSRGNAADGSNTDFVVPDGLVGTGAKDAEKRLDGDVRVTRVTVPSSSDRNSVISTWPLAGERTADGVVVLVVSGGDKGDSGDGGDEG